MNNNFYVYTYTNPVTEEIIYVGKGKGKRKYQHWVERDLDTKTSNPFFKRVLRKMDKLGIEPIIAIVKDNLPEEEAFCFEIELIEAIGRRDKGQGTLCNLTDGGEGISGFIRTEELNVAQQQAMLELMASRPDEYTQCDVCGKTARLINGEPSESFLKTHLSNCTTGTMTRDLKRSKPAVTDSPTDITFLLEQCESMEEYRVRRYFYGNLVSLDDEFEDLDDYLYHNSDTQLDNFGTGGRLDYSSQGIDDDLMEYSLKGISAIKL